jgi:Zn-dependent metalloprotease
MQRILFTFSILFLSILFSISYGQKNNWLWIDASEGQFRSDNISDLKTRLDIYGNNDLRIISHETDRLNVSHTKFRQYVSGYPVEGGVLIHHSYPDGRQLVNGLWLENFNPTMAGSMISVGQALKIIETVFPAHREKGWMRFPENDRFKPETELVWFDRNHSTNAEEYRLAYKISCIVSSPYQHYNVYVDANTGMVLHKYSTTRTINVPASGEGYHSGDVEFTVDSIRADHYEMRQSERNGSVSIYTYDSPYRDTEKLFESSDNTWPNKIAVDCHWGVEKAIDYFYNRHGREGITGQGGDVIVRVHVRDPFTGEPMENAFWDGSINIGDGDPNGTLKKPLSSLNIIAHELAHGVTEYSADLIYSDESGSINEAFSDIFGATIVAEYLPEYTWDIGGEVDYVFRRMNDPNSVQMPAYYKGEYWSESNNPPHQNGAVGSLWYYYLVEGGNGNNEVGDTFFIQALGFETAAKIAYRSLTVYLTENSDFHDFYTASLQSAIDLYGVCSDEAVNVTRAWAAVGVGEPIYDNDFKMVGLDGLESACGLGFEPVKVNFNFNSCNITIPEGTSLILSYSLNGGTEISEEYLTETELTGGENLEYTFETLPDLSETGNYEIKIWVSFELDEYNSNDTVTLTIENRLVQNEDFGMADISRKEGTEVCGFELKGFDFEIQFLGCDHLPEGTLVPISFDLDGNKVLIDLILDDELEYGETRSFEFPLSLTAGSYGIHELTAKVSFPGDPFPGNNIITKSFTFHESLGEEVLYDFNLDSDADEFIISQGSRAFKYTIESRTDKPSEGNAIYFGGGEIVDWNTFEMLFDIPLYEEDIWELNQEYESMMCKCVDAREWDRVFLDFDMFISQVKDIWLDFFGISDYLFANMRVLIDGVPVTPTFGDTDGKYLRKSIDLSDYANQEFQLCFQMKGIVGKNIFIFFGVPGGDNVRLDNIRISHTPVSSNDLPLTNNSLLLYPVPGNESLKINISDPGSGNAIIQILNNSGQVVHTKHEQLTGSENKLEINIHDLRPGIYFLRITDQKTGNTRTAKFIKI